MTVPGSGGFWTNRGHSDFLSLMPMPFFSIHKIWIANFLANIPDSLGCFSTVGKLLTARPSLIKCLNCMSLNQSATRFDPTPDGRGSCRRSSQNYVKDAGNRLSPIADLETTQKL